jgi:hypothetical protein
MTRPQMVRVFILANTLADAEQFSRSVLGLRQGEGKWSWLRRASQVQGLKRGHALVFEAAGYLRDLNDPAQSDLHRYVDACDIPVFVARRAGVES